MKEERKERIASFVRPISFLSVQTQLRDRSLRRGDPRRAAISRVTRKHLPSYKQDSVTMLQLSRTNASQGTLPPLDRKRSSRWIKSGRCARPPLRWAFSGKRDDSISYIRYLFGSLRSARSPGRNQAVTVSAARRKGEDRFFFLLSDV